MPRHGSPIERLRAHVERLRVFVHIEEPQPCIAISATTCPVGAVNRAWFNSVKSNAIELNGGYRVLHSQHRSRRQRAHGDQPRPIGHPDASSSQSATLFGSEGVREAVEYTYATPPRTLGGSRPGVTRQPRPAAHRDDALGSTLPYCDVVVTDKAAAGHAIQTGLAGRLGTTITSRLQDLIALL